MKKITLFAAAAFLFFSITSSAQITKGSTFLGGSVGFSSNKDEGTMPGSTSTQENKSSTWSVNPQWGKAIANNKILGVYLNISGTTNKNTNYKPKTSMVILTAAVFFIAAIILLQGVSFCLVKPDWV